MADKPTDFDPALELTGRLWEAHKEHEGLKRIRLSNRDLAAEMAKRTGISVDQTTVGTWFKATPPKPWYLKALAELYGVSRDWLVWGEGEKRVKREDLKQYDLAKPFPVEMLETTEDKRARRKAAQDASKKKKA